ncbi:MAG: hypothetical protein NTV51_15200, partial [Verrucomicrobia bacterium]|nr:hypothetical protein [Verrucomicrobiota bacterium]
RLAAPLWLEQACVGWWRARADPAQWDALKQASARLAPPALTDLLEWQRGREEPPALVIGSVWLLAFLQGESSRAGEWPALLHRLLGGEAPLPALVATYPGRLANDSDRELWWQTGWHHLRTARVLPGLEAGESRAELAAFSRFVFLRDSQDVVVPLRDVLARTGDPDVSAELQRRSAALNRVLPLLHPFYRNAGLSLVEALSARGPTAAKRETLCAAFEQDWSDATELESASTAALDALERKTAFSPNK